MRELEAWTLVYLVNALWQAPVVFAAAWAMSRLARRGAPGTLHTIWVTALLAEAVLPACPATLAVWVRAAWSELLAWHRDATREQVRVRLGTGLAGGNGALRLPPAVLTGVAVLYGCAVLYFAARLAWGLWRTRAMRLRAQRLEEERHGLDVRVSEEIAGPVTVGLWRGAVLLPAGFLERVTEEDLRAVLAHEGAHVRRRDFLKNALYGLLTVPVAFHPAVWLTRRRVAESREMVCDAMAAEAMAGRERYAGSLLRLASMRVAGTPERMLHAIGIFGMFDANSFERRVMNLTTRRMEMKGARRVAVAVACGALTVGTCASALALRVGVPLGQSEGNPQSSGGDNRIARVSGGVMAGNVLSKVTPVYPVDAKAEGVTGAVVLNAVIGTDGTVENLQVVSGPEKLRVSALDAVRQWTYKPYLLNGVPTEVQTVITVTYSLAR